MVDEAGRVVVHSGAASVGQGMETVVGQIVADTLDVPIDSIEVRHGQTDDVPFGMGAFASRVTVMTGSAAHINPGETESSPEGGCASRSE